MKNISVMNIISISIAVVLCISANVVAMEQPKKQEQPSSVKKSLCWMCEKENVEGQSAYYTMQPIPVGSGGRVLWCTSGVPHTVRLHKSCCDPVTAAITQTFLAQMDKEGISPTLLPDLQKMLYVLYALTKIKNKTVQTYITENDNDVPLSVLQIIATGTYPTLYIAVKLQ